MYMHGCVTRACTNTCVCVCLYCTHVRVHAISNLFVVEVKLFFHRNCLCPAAARLHKRVPMASTAAVAVGKFGFVVLVDVHGKRSEVECFVVAQEAAFSVVLTPIAEPQTSEAEWLSSAAAGPASSTNLDEPTLTVGETRAMLKKVETCALRVLPQKGSRVDLRFEPRPAAAPLLAAFYGSEFAREDAQTQLLAASTDDGGRSRRHLEMENKRLSKELQEMRNREQSRRSSARASPERSRATRHHIASEESGEDEDEASSEVEPSGALMGERDALMEAFAKFQYPGDHGDSKRATAGERPPRRGRQTPAAREHGRVPEAADEVPPRRSRPSRPHSRNREEMSLKIQLEMLEVLKDMKSVRGGACADDAPAGGELDGLRVLRCLGRMRALREDIEKNPNRTWKEFKQMWVTELGSEDRAFRWTDVNRFVKWKKYTSLKRCHWMLCHILESLEKNEPEYARAQVVQCMKALQEFPNTGSWRAAWELTHMVDPLRPQKHGGTEVEMETIMGLLKTRDDLRNKVHKGVKEMVSDDAGDDDGGDDNDQQAAAAKAAKAGGKRRGKKQ